MPVQWPEAGQQLLRRIQWDVNGSSPVRVMALSEFCRAMERCQLPVVGVCVLVGMDGFWHFVALAEETSNKCLPVNIGDMVKCQNRCLSGSIDNLPA